jgi:hypothetical protein
MAETASAAEVICCNGPTRYQYGGSSSPCEEDEPAVVQVVAVLAGLAPPDGRGTAPDHLHARSYELACARRTSFTTELQACSDPGSIEEARFR